jgi:hypothetical protein
MYGSSAECDSGTMYGYSYQQVNGTCTAAPPSLQSSLIVPTTLSNLGLCKQTTLTTSSMVNASGITLPGYNDFVPYTSSFCWAGNVTDKVYFPNIPSVLQKYLADSASGWAYVNRYTDAGCSPKGFVEQEAVLTGVCLTFAAGTSRGTYRTSFIFSFYFPILPFSDENHLKS